jgi:hypothetical protein
MFWNFLVWALFPVPTFLLVVLSLPLPQFAKGPGEPIKKWFDIMQCIHTLTHINILCTVVRKVILKITDVIFGKIRVGAWHVTLYHLAMGLSSALLFVSSSKLMSKSKNGGETVHFQNPHCERFRAERNFWISILAFTM